MDSLSINQSLPPLSWLQAFEAAARLESFTLAGQELGRSQATISQQIRYLENRLDSELFHRLPRGVELTLDGAAYMPHVRSAFETIAASTRDLFATNRHATVTIATPVSLIAGWLAPRLPELDVRSHRINLSIATINRPVDYEMENADLEIHYGDGAWPGVERKLILEERLSPVCAPALLDTVSHWRQLPVIGLAGARAGWSEWCAAAGVAPLATPVFRFDSFVLALEAAQAGAGILLASLPLVESQLRAGTLVRLSDVELRPKTGHWLTRDHRKPVKPETQVVWHWIIGLAS
ncbi:LysR substrate-binding domain-containing protein [Marinobacter sp. VGCF2001]|uniref:LysR substrate-binding domain-containing protein n=1 Tax=Marinobacter sp. VGCF2001 TaxID=3417189 RepID=UPI003CE85336